MAIYIGQDEKFLRYRLTLLPAFTSGPPARLTEPFPAPLPVSKVLSGPGQGEKNDAETEDDLYFFLSTTQTEVV